MRTLAKVIAIVCCMVFITPLTAMAQIEMEGDAMDIATEAASSLPLINSQSWSVSDVTIIELSYSKGDFITIESVTGDKITLNEYLTENNTNYYATATLSGGNLKLTQGNRPNSSYNSHTVLLLPENYTGTISVNNSGGSISLYNMTSNATYDLYNGGGRITVDNVAAKTIKAACPYAGTLKITNTTAALDINLSGTINISSSIINGSIKNSGQITQMTINLSQLSGNLSISNASGMVVLGMPNKESFKLNGTVTKTDGNRIVNNFGYGNFTTIKNTITGSNGSNPSNTVTVTTSDRFTFQLTR